VAAQTPLSTARRLAGRASTRSDKDPEAKMEVYMKSRKATSRVTWALAIFILTLIGGFTDSAMASSMTYQRDYSYQASEADSKLSCRTLALEQVKRLLLEELGSYLVSNTEVKDFQISRDQVIAITAGIVRTEVLKEKWDGSTYYIVAKITTDPSHVAKAIDELRKDKQGLGELEEVKRKTEELRMELEKLREELKSSKGEQQTQEKKDYNEAIKKLDAVDWFKEGLALAESGKYRDAISFYNNAIDADPKNAAAYSVRGWAYYKIGDYSSALKDTNRALYLKTDFPSALVNRSTTLWGMKQYDKALVDINRSIELKPDYSRAYQIRSLIHISMKNEVKAVEDGNKAIEFNPKNSYAYHNRGNAYRNLGRYEEAFKDPNVYHGRGYAYFLQKKYDDALRDINKALEMNQNPATALANPVSAVYLRGLVYNQLKDYKGAIQDFSKVIEFEKDNAGAYYNRSLSYKQIGKADESASDLKKAAQLRDVQTQKATKK
jgi:tetratricopeptide (TPR) repeat protein